MTDLFIRCWASTTLRLGLMIASVERARMLPDSALTLVVSERSLIPVAGLKRWMELGVKCIDLPASEYWRTSKQVAEAEAKSDPYVVMDDDALPIGKDWLATGIRILTDHPEYGMLSSWSINGEVPPKGEILWEEESVGTPYFVRKGLLYGLPAGELGNYDAIVSHHVQDQRFKTGFMRGVRHNHTGYGLSQVIPSWWLA